MKRFAKRMLALLLCMTALCSVMALVSAEDEPLYKDVPEDAWYYDAVQFVSERGVMLGVGEDVFAPEDTLSRAMTATLFWRTAGSKESFDLMDGQIGFSQYRLYMDLEESDWHAPGVAWCIEEGIMEGESLPPDLGPSGEPVPGFGRCNFRPDAPTTREELAVVLYRYAEYVGLYRLSESQVSVQFADEKEISPWAKNAVAWCAAYEIFRGDGEGERNMRPQETITRAEAAAVLMRFFSLADQKGK